MLKKIAILSLSAFVLIGCTKPEQPPQNAGANVAATQKSSDDSLVSGHSQNSSAEIVPKSETKTKWTQSGNPVDVSGFNAEIAAAQKDLAAKPKDDAAKKTLAEAFLKRGIALTDARQYASALGDYRRVLKYDGENDEAQKWIDEIVNIYAMINREYPPEGEEPPPLPFEKKN